MPNILESTNIDGVQYQEQSSAPTDPTTGFLRTFADTSARYRWITDATHDVFAQGAIFSQTSSTTVADTVTESALMVLGQGSLTVPANGFVVGRTFRITARGHFSNTGTPTLNIIAKIGSVAVVSTGLVATITGTSNNGWECIVDITCRSVGASGSFVGAGFFSHSVSSAVRTQMVNTGTATVDTTASNAISLTATWGTASASNTITCQIGIVEWIF